MIKIAKDLSFIGKDIPFGVLDVLYPPKEEWDEKSFQILKEQELEEVMRLAKYYNRKDIFGEDPYFLYFRKFKKTYPVMMQVESLIQKTRKFPNINLVNQIAFLVELKTHTLLGTHDIDRIEGELTLFRGTEKIPFCGIHDSDVHIYPGDISGRDNLGIIFSMIAGADNRTCITADTRHVAYFVFGIDGIGETRIRTAFDLLTRYVKTLAPAAHIESIII